MKTYEEDDSPEVDPVLIIIVGVVIVIERESDKQTREDPVVSRVLKDVENGHSSVGETMNENGFELTLHVVEDDTEEGESGERQG